MRVLAMVVGRAKRATESKNRKFSWPLRTSHGFIYTQVLQVVGRKRRKRVEIFTASKDFSDRACWLRDVAAQPSPAQGVRREGWEGEGVGSRWGPTKSHQRFA